MKNYKRPEGELQYVHGRIQDVVQNGYPEVGWEGDKLLTVYFNRRDDEWQVLDHAFSPPQVIIRKSANGLRDLDFRSLCMKLKNAQFKGQGVQSIVDRIEARNAELEKQKDYTMRQYNEEAAEKLAWAVGLGLD